MLPKLISFKHISLPNSVQSRVQKTVDDIWSYAHSEKHIEELKKVSNEHELKILKNETPQKSVLSAYDFHYEPNADKLSLIEVNTNASTFLVADALYDFQSKEKSFGNAKQELLSSFRNEHKLFGIKEGAKIFIIDEKLPQQKMLFGFHMYKDFLKSISDNVQICDFSEVTKSDKEAFVYNRYCDFLLSRPESKVLLDHFLNGDLLFSPNPRVYLLTAAKERLNHFTEMNVTDTLIPSKAFRQFENADAIWSERKKYYFKPMRMYGGKAVFRGKSISRKRFDELDMDEYMAQESRPPGKIEDDWKFDLRFYTYANKIQLVIARVFKGQLLNFNTIGGGLATVDFNS